MGHFALENGFKAQQKKRGQCVFTKLTKVTKYIMCYRSRDKVSHPGYMSKKLPWSRAATATLVETTQGHSPASLMTGQHVFRP